MAKQNYRVLPRRNLESTGAVGAISRPFSFGDPSSRFAGVPNLGKPLYRGKTVYNTDSKTHKTAINQPMDHTGET